MMKKSLIHLCAAVLCTISFPAFSQMNTGGQPLSYSLPILRDVNPPTARVYGFDADAVAAEDALSDAQGRVPRYAKFLDANFTLENSGEWTALKNGDRVWRLRVETSGAQATLFLYDDFQIPEGGRLFIYNEDKSQHIGAFTSSNNEDGGTYATELVYGSSVTLEYFEPVHSAGLGRISIEKVGYAYRFVMDEGFSGQSDNGQRGGDPCQVDINCSPEGNNWQDQKRGVMRVSVVSNQGAGWCSASMVNNTALDCKNYVLSAFHCGDGSNSNHFGQYTFYFNYERSGCGTGSAPQNQTMVGCAKRADSGDGGGNSGSDFMLLELNSTPPSNYNIYYNGWNRQNVGSPNGVSIHHPAGGRKKVSTYTQTLTTTGWGINNTHWRVVWAATTNGHGVTEGGSSGSPIFNNAGLIVGTLTGGGSYCSTPTQPDQYGKMSYHWSSNPGDDLSDWLDPGNTGVTSLAGTYAPCNSGQNPPVADFLGNPTTVGVGANVTFTDLSTNSPNQWSWNFGDGNTSTTQNPVHAYGATGQYTVQLTAINANGSDSETKQLYITVTNGQVNTTCDSLVYLDGQYIAQINPTDEPNFTAQLIDNDQEPVSQSLQGQGYTSDWLQFYEVVSPGDTNFFWGAASWHDDTSVPADNWITFGPITIPSDGADLSWKHAFANMSYRDGYRVVLNYTGTDVADFNGGTVLFSVADNAQSTAGDTDWASRSVNLPGGTYAGQEVYIGFHHDALDMLILYLDDFYMEGCETTIIQNDPPVADFVGNPTTVGVGANVTFTDLSINSPNQWSWNFGDGSTSTTQNPVHAYSATGQYTVQLTATNANGSDSETKQLYITVVNTDPPVADFVGNPTTVGVGTNVTFTDLSTNSPNQWSWNFGDGSASTTQNPVHAYGATGQYTVQLTATNANGSYSETKQLYITVVNTDPPVADFVGVPTTVGVGENVTFTDLSTNSPNQWSWNFGDGNTSTTQNPVHAYAATGQYTVQLTATNANGSDSETKQLYITVTIPTGIDNESNVQNLEVFPNPSNANFTIRLENSSEEALQMNLINAVGQFVWTDLINDKGTITTVISGEELAPGIYTLAVRSEDVVVYRKLVVTK